MAFEDRLRDVVKSADLTIDQFARELDESPQRIKDVLRAKQKPPADLLVKIHLMFGVDINWLLIGDRKVAGPAEPLAVLLQPRERELVRLFRAADDAGRQFIETAAMRSAQATSPGAATISQSNTGQGAVQIGRAGRVSQIKTGR